VNYVGVLALLEFWSRVRIASDTYGDEALGQVLGEIQDLPGLVPSGRAPDGDAVVLLQSYLHG
jgi:hypothetical protein